MNMDYSIYHVCESPGSYQGICEYKNIDKLGVEYLRFENDNGHENFT